MLTAGAFRIARYTALGPKLKSFVLYEYNKKKPSLSGNGVLQVIAHRGEFPYAAVDSSGADKPCGKGQFANDRDLAR